MSGVARIAPSTSDIFIKMLMVVVSTMNDVHSITKLCLVSNIERWPVGWLLDAQCGCREREVWYNRAWQLLTLRRFVCKPAHTVNRNLREGRRREVKRGIGVLWVVLVAASLVACRPVATQPQAPTATPSPPASPTPPYSHTPIPTPTSTPSPTPPPTPTSAWPPPLTPPYTLTGDPATGRIRGRLFFPSEFIPPLAVYAVATDGSRFYRVDTQMVPPGEPSYEIPVVEPGTYHVYAYPALFPSPGKEGAGGEVERESPFGGAYSYLAACEAGHFPPPPEGCWENPQHDPAPVKVQAGQAVEEINIYDWYGPSLPPPPDDTSAWPTYTDEQLTYRIRYPPHWEVRSERQGETTFGPTYLPSPPPHQGSGSPGEEFASVRVTNGDPEELADELIGSLPPGEVVSREWLPFAGHQGLHLVLDLPEGQFAWWFVLRYELVYVVHAVTDSGLGSFDQMVETFAFLDSPQPVPTDISTPEPTLPPSPMPTSDAPPGDEPTPTPDCAANPAPPHSTIAGRRLVAFYGVPIGRGLGILGASGRCFLATARGAAKTLTVRAIKERKRAAHGVAVIALRAKDKVTRLIVPRG